MVLVGGEARRWWPRQGPRWGEERLPTCAVVDSVICFGVDGSNVAPPEVVVVQVSLLFVVGHRRRRPRGSSRSLRLMVRPEVTALVVLGGLLAGTVLPHYEPGFG